MHTASVIDPSHLVARNWKFIERAQNAASVKYERALVAKRIDHTHLVDLIELKPDELKLYNGCGWSIASFAGGRLTALYYLNNAPLESTPGSTIARYTARALAELRDSDCAQYLVMASCTALYHLSTLDVYDKSSTSKLSNACHAVCLSL